MAKHEYFVENSHWTLLTINQKSETIGSQSLVSFTLQLKRNPTFVVFYVAIPVVMLAILNVFTFALPPASGEKGSFSIVVFLSFVVYIIVTYQKMPENSDRISLFALYVLIMTLLSCITCMLTAIELRIVSTKSVHKTTSQRVKNFTGFICNLQHKLLCINNDAYNAGTLNNTTNRQSNDNNQWQLFVSALDFLFFWLFLALSLVLTLCFLIYLSVQ